VDVGSDVVLGAPIGRREENKRRKREALLREGLAHFARDGFTGASIEQIAAAAGVARGTFYLYFPDKLALFQTLGEAWLEPLEELLAATAEQLARCESRDEVGAAYQQMAETLALVGLGHPDEILVAFQASRQPHEAGRWLRTRELALIDRVVAFTEGVVAKGLIDVGNPRVACLVVYGAVERLFYEFLSGADLGPPGRLADEVVGLFGVAMGFRSQA